MIRALTSASNLFRRAACAGSARMEEGLPDEDSEQSREGDLLHRLDATGWNEKDKLTPYQRDLLEISDRLDERVFGSVATQFGIDASESFAEGRETELWVHRGIKKLLPGHCDRWRFYPERRLLVIIDKKFGYKVVTEAASNKQLRAYAVAGAEKWPSDNVVVAITQPRLAFDDRLTMSHYTVPDLAAARADIVAILAACAEPDAPLVAGEEQCRYCKAKLLCPAFRESIDAGLKLIPFPATGTSVAKREADIARTLAEMPDTDLHKTLVALQMAGFIAEPARDEARKRLEANPDALPEWKLGKEQETREIEDVEQAVALLTVGGTLSRAEVLGSARLSIGGVETKLRERREAAGTKCTWKEAKDEIAERLAPVITRGTKKPSLTRVKV